MSICEEKLVTVSALHGELKIDWHGDWATWPDLTNSAEVQAFTKRASDALNRSAKAAGKCKKGKKGGGAFNR